MRRGLIIDEFIYIVSIYCRQNCFRVCTHLLLLIIIGEGQEVDPEANGMRLSTADKEAESIGSQDRKDVIRTNVIKEKSGDERVFNLCLRDPFNYSVYSSGKLNT